MEVQAECLAPISNMQIFTIFRYLKYSTSDKGPNLFKLKNFVIIFELRMLEMNLCIGSGQKQ